MKYKLIQKRNPANPEAPQKWYATSKNQGKITIEKLSKDIAGRSSLTRGDVISVIENLLDEIPKHLINGNTVSLGDFCSLRLSISGKGSESPEKFTTANIQKTKVIFTPSPTMKKELSQIKYERDDSSK